MTTLAEELGHLKHHVKYPTNKANFVETCNKMADIPVADRNWITGTLPEGNYRNPEEVLKALLTKV